MLLDIVFETDIIKINIDGSYMIKKKNVSEFLLLTLRFFFFKSAW